MCHVRCETVLQLTGLQKFAIVQCSIQPRRY